MIQYGLDIPIPLEGYFTLEKEVIGKSLYEIEDVLGYQKGRLLQGADFYLLSTPMNSSDFEIMGTTLFQGHKMEKAPLKKSLNSIDTKRKHIQKFKRSRLIKVVPLQIHLQAMRQFLSDEQYFLIQDMSTHGLTKKEFINQVVSRFSNNHNLIDQIKSNFEKIDNIYKANTEMNNILYPSAVGGAVPQWRLLKKIPARCICRITDYLGVRYQSAF